MFSPDEIKAQVNEWILKFKEKEEEKKIHPAWKKLRPNRDAMDYRLPGSLDK